MCHVVRSAPGTTLCAFNANYPSTATVSESSHALRTPTIEPSLAYERLHIIFVRANLNCNFSFIKK